MRNTQTNCKYQNTRLCGLVYRNKKHVYKQTKNYKDVSKRVQYRVQRNVMWWHIHTFTIYI